MPNNYITVTFGKVPGPTSTYNLNGDRTVAALLKEAQADATGFQVIVNDSRADVNTALRHGDTVLLTKKIQGN